MLQVKRNIFIHKQRNVVVFCFVMFAYIQVLKSVILRLKSIFHYWMDGLVKPCSMVARIQPVRSADIHSPAHCWKCCSTGTWFNKILPTEKVPHFVTRQVEEVYIFAIEDFGARSRYSCHGWIITSHSIPWDTITYPCRKYLHICVM